MARDGGISRLIFAAIVIDGQCQGVWEMDLARWLEACMRYILVRHTMNKRRTVLQVSMSLSESTRTENTKI